METPQFLGDKVTARAILLVARLPRALVIQTARIAHIAVADLIEEVLRTDLHLLPQRRVLGNVVEPLRVAEGVSQDLSVLHTGKVVASRKRGHQDGEILIVVLGRGISVADGASVTEGQKHENDIQA